MVLISLLVIIYISFISLGLPDSLLGAAWPSMYQLIDAPISYAGIISMIGAGGSIISTMFSGRILKKFNTGIVTAVSVFMTAFALFGISISNSFIELCAFAIPLGFGAGGVDSALNNYVALHYKARHMSWLHCFWGVGATAGPVILSYWLIAGQWRMGYRTISIIQFVLVGILIVALPLWKKVSKMDEIKEEVVVEKKMLSVAGLMKLPGAKAALIAFFSYCSIEATVGVWGSTFLVMTRGIDAKTAASWISMFYFGITFGRLLSGFITIKFNQRQMIRMGLILLAIGIVLLFIPGTEILLLPGLFMIGLGCAPIFPSLLHETPKNFGAQYSQSVMGIQMASAYIGSTFMPMLFGFLAFHFGYGLFQVFMGVFLVLMFAMVEKLHKRVDRVKM